MADNKEIARRFMQAFEKGDQDALRAVVADDVHDNDLPPGAPQGIEGLLGAVAMFNAAFPDLWIRTARQLAEGDFVFQHGRFGGTQRGELFGIPPTGKSVDIAFMDCYRIDGDKIVETWRLEDIAGMLRQLGVAPG